MTGCRVLVVTLALTGLATPAPAGFGLFSRKPKSNPAERVPELLIQLKTSPDESQRVAAAEELRQYDPKAFPEIIPTLTDALGRDASPSVRSNVAESLGKLRPISQKVGYALEQAVANDGSMRVRPMSWPSFSVPMIWLQWVLDWGRAKARRPACVRP